jgi:hypothetical protein
MCSTCELWLVRRCWKATAKNTWVLLSLAFIAVTTFLANVYLVRRACLVRGASIADCAGQAVDLAQSRLTGGDTNDVSFIT